MAHVCFPEFTEDRITVVERTLLRTSIHGYLHWMLGYSMYGVLQGLILTAQGNSRFLEA